MTIKKQQGLRRGGALVESALVLVTALFFLYAIFDYGRYLMISQLLNNAVREGARQAVVSTNTASTATIQATVIQYLAGQSILNSAGKTLSASDVQVYQATSTTGAAATPDSTWTDAALGSSIAVRVTALYKPIFPTFGFLPSSFTIQATAMMSSEAN